jgi:hypothetical protein
MRFYISRSKPADHFENLKLCWTLQSKSLISSLHEESSFESSKSSYRDSFLDSYKACDRIIHNLLCRDNVTMYLVSSVPAGSEQMC